LNERSDYIARDSPEAAERFLRAAFDAFDRIADFPRIGAAPSYRNARLTDLRRGRVPGFENYLVFYVVREEAVRIVRVLHGAQDLEVVLRDEADEGG
jgi:toxin ParE1/3/4